MRAKYRRFIKRWGEKYAAIYLQKEPKASEDRSIQKWTIMEPFFWINLYPILMFFHKKIFYLFMLLCVYQFICYFVFITLCLFIQNVTLYYFVSVLLYVYLSICCFMFVYFLHYVFFMLFVTFYL